MRMATIEIRRKADNVVRTIEADWAAALPVEKGLFLCDCNIGGLFALAAGEPNPELGCGFDKFAVKVIDRAGKVLYADQD